MEDIQGCSSEERGGAQRQQPRRLTSDAHMDGEEASSLEGGPFWTERFSSLHLPLHRSEAINSSHQRSSPLFGSSVWTLLSGRSSGSFSLNHSAAKRAMLPLEHSLLSGRRPNVQRWRRLGSPEGLSARRSCWGSNSVGSVDGTTTMSSASHQSKTVLKDTAWIGRGSGCLKDCESLETNLMLLEAVEAMETEGAKSNNLHRERSFEEEPELKQSDGLATEERRSSRMSGFQTAACAMTSSTVECSEMTRISQRCIGGVAECGPGSLIKLTSSSASLDWKSSYFWKYGCLSQPLLGVLLGFAIKPGAVLGFGQSSRRIAREVRRLQMNRKGNR